ncbi:hypothetical protein SLA2020_016760 [Shorea laevis]
MKIISYNVRGLNNVLKKKDVRSLVLKEKVEMVFLQETKLEGVEYVDCRVIWGVDDFDREAKDATGRSGGLLCVWHKDLFVKESTMVGNWFICLKGLWGPNEISYSFINVYAPYNLQEKLQMWNELKDVISSIGGKVSVVGDFNVVLNSSERVGRLDCSREIIAFNEFLLDVGLVDL